MVLPTGTSALGESTDSTLPSPAQAMPCDSSHHLRGGSLASTAMLCPPALRGVLLADPGQDLALAELAEVDLEPQKLVLWAALGRQHLRHAQVDLHEVVDRDGAFSLRSRGAGAPWASFHHRFGVSWLFFHVCLGGGLRRSAATCPYRSAEQSWRRGLHAPALAHSDGQTSTDSSV